MKKLIILLALLLYNLHGSVYTMQMQDDDDDQFSLLPLPAIQEQEYTPEEQAAQAIDAQEVPEEQAAQATDTQEIALSPEEQAAQAEGAQEIPEEQSAQAIDAQEIVASPEEQAAQAVDAQEIAPSLEEQATQEIGEPAEPETPAPPPGPEIKPTQFTTLELEKSEKLIKSANRKVYRLYEQASKVTQEIDEALNTLSIMQKKLYDDYYQATDSLDLFYQQTSFIKGQFGTEKK